MINIEGMDYYRAQQLIDATVDFAHRVMASPDMREAVHKKVNELRQEGFFEKHPAPPVIPSEGG